MVKIKVDIPELKFNKERFLKEAGLKIANYSKTHMGKGACPDHSCLWIKTGRLRASIRTLKVGYNFVDIGTNVWYGAIHEYGLKKIWEVKPKRAKALKITLPNGQVIFRKRAVIKGIPARPFLKPAGDWFLNKEVEKTLMEVFEI